jgi:hypothetical protein
MNIKKAIVASVILYAVIFLAASALLFIKDENIFGSITLVISTVLIYLISKEFYFKDMKIANPIKEGLVLGMVMDVVMFLIDIPLMVYGFAASSGWSYFMNWHMLLGYLLTLIIPVLVAYRKK